MDLSRLCNVILSNFDFNDIGLIIIIVILLILSAFFSSTETAFASTNIVRLRVYTEEGKKGAKRALLLAENYEKTLITVLVGNNIVNIAIATFGARFFANFILNPNLADLISTLSITAIVLVFGEILPKSFAKNHADAFVLRFGFVVSFLSIILKPLTLIFGAINKLVSRKKHDENEPSVTEGELEAILDTMNEEGVIHDDEAELIQSVLDLNDKTVEDIMVPRVDIVAVDINDDVEKIKKTFFDSQFSRIPVYEDDKDNIIGILYERDFFTKIIKKQRINIKTLVKPALYVSKSMKVDALIHELQTKKMHIAIVSGEYGQTSGIVTMEDALEELVGEIYDEHDDDVNVLVKRINDNEYIVDANIEMGDLFDFLNINKELDDKYMKLASWFYEQTEEIPSVGNEINLQVDYVQKDDENDKYVDYSKNLHFIINEVEERRIISVKLLVEDLNNDLDSE